MQRTLQPLAEQQAVGQIGQRIVQRHMSNPRFDQDAAAADIGEGVDEAAALHWLVGDVHHPPVRRVRVRKSRCDAATRAPGNRCIACPRVLFRHQSSHWRWRLTKSRSGWRAVSWSVENIAVSALSATINPPSAPNMQRPCDIRLGPGSNAAHSAPVPVRARRAGGPGCGAVPRCVSAPRSM